MIEFRFKKTETDALFKAYKKFPKLVESNMIGAVRSALNLISSDARKNHRFTTRSGTLERSIKQMIKSRRPLIGRVEIDRGQAPYGRRIHEGFGSWSSDRFLYRSAEKNRKKARELIKKGIITSIKKAGL